MNEPKNIRIVLVQTKQMERKDLEQIENNLFKNVAEVLDTMFDIHVKSKKTPHLNVSILTPNEFRREIAFNKALKSFNQAMLNVRKRKQCYKLTDFMDDFNNQEFGDETEQYWMGYVRVKQ